MRLLSLILIAAAHAQTVKVHALKVSAGAMACTFERRAPAALTGLFVECVAVTANVKQNGVIEVGSAGYSGQLLIERDTISWTIQRPTAEGALLYKITANGKTETGSL